MQIQPPSQTRKQKWITLVLALVALAVFSIWLALTPPGLLGKLGAAGYSVCHQIEEHTLTIDGRFLPLCARCTGTFTGLLVTIAFLSRRGKRSGVPSRLMIAVLALFFVGFAVDGINSAVSMIPGVQPLYPPDNLLRLLTGLLFGVALGTLSLTLWNQTLWKESDNEPLLHTWGQMLVLVLLVVGCGLIILADLPWLYFPIALFSILSIFTILSIIYSLLWCIILKKENTLHQFRDGMRIYIAGITTAIIQVGLMDLIRYLLTGTWNSF